MDLGSAEVIQKGWSLLERIFKYIFVGSDITLVGWGAQVRVLQEASDLAMNINKISCEIIDLQTLLPWDKNTVVQSVNKTGRLLIAHEAPKTGGFSGEISAQIQENCILKLKGPIRRVTGWDTPFPLVYERFYLPNKFRCYDEICKSFYY